MHFWCRYSGPYIINVYVHLLCLYPGQFGSYQMQEGLDDSYSMLTGGSKGTLSSGIFIDDPTEFKCQPCHQGFPSKACNEAHNMVVHNKYCDVCQGRLDDVPHYKLLRHGLKHTGQKPHQCEFCYKLFANTYSLKSHQKKDLKCVICDRIVSYSNKSKHVKLHR
ncbi:unnamed protein product [Owenia fusiformis]|uniref:C2H2-type domain-containing protein n=1 Tax=Owenia fusiformis TaxID=6347 RepID=A0A8S4N721_OWEFU|nr:unnamed protein product [Owenia fusiformis]